MRVVLFLILGCNLCSYSRAQMSQPGLKGVHPLGLGAGETGTLEIRGSNLEHAAIVFDGEMLPAEVSESSGDRVKIKVTVPRDATPGPHSFRVSTPKGISESGQIYVGRPIPTIFEKEPNNGFRKPQMIAGAAMLAGEIKGGDDVDLFAIEMKAGQTLVAEAIAARAGSGLDALEAIFSPDGRELASDDDLFGRDAAAWCVVPEAGRYLVQIQDANGRNPNGNLEPLTNRDYLLAIGEFPLVLSTFPAGGRRGASTKIALVGISLPEGRDYRHVVRDDAGLGDSFFRLQAPNGIANPVPFRVGEIAEFLEGDADTDDDPHHPTPVVVPAAINGRFAPRDDGDVDSYRLTPASGREGNYAITAYAARFGSAADPVIAVMGEIGKPAAEDDDKLGRDARIETRIGPEGLNLSIREYFGRGGPRYVYRIEVEPLEPRRIKIEANLGLRTIPRDGCLAVPISLDRVRYDGPTTILAGPLPDGVKAWPVTIPARSSTGVIVFQAEKTATLGVFPLRMVVRDVGAPAEVVFKELGRRRGPPKEGGDGKPLTDEVMVEIRQPLLAVAEPAVLGMTVETREITLSPTVAAEIKVRLERRGDAAKKGIKLKLMAGGGGFDGIELASEATVKPELSEHVFVLKTKPGATSRRMSLTVRGWFEGGSEHSGVDTAPVEAIVP